MKEIVANPGLVAYCGLYCGACKKYLKEKCPGCHENHGAKWCKLRICCMDNRYTSCASCADFTDPSECKLFNNWMSRIFGFIFRSNRAACIAQIKEVGIDGHAQMMTQARQHSIKR